MSILPSRRHPALLLRAMSALLAYPDAALRAALPEITRAIHATRAVDAGHREALVALAEDIRSRDPLQAEARHVEWFDRGRHTSLNLFEHVHGDGRKRGPAMLELRQRYLDAGMEPVGPDLPDHLPLLLEYLSCRDKAEIRDTIGEIAHILRKLGNTLTQRGSPHAAVMAALLALGNEKGLDAARPPAPPPDDIDREWEEKPAFAPPETHAAMPVEPSTP